MIRIGRGVKISVFATLCSLLIYIVYLMPGSYAHLINVILGRPDLYSGNIGTFIAEHVGLNARFFAVIIALTTGFLIWGGEIKSHATTERLVETALFLEGTYFVLLFPKGLWTISNGVNPEGISYILQAASAGTVLMILSFKVRHWTDGSKVLNWIGIGVVGYVSALWFDVIFSRWFDMIALLGGNFILRGVASWWFLSSMVTMSLAVVFSIFGAYFLYRNKGESIWWFGLSLIMVGIHYVIYLAFAFLSINLDFVLPLEVWTLPFLGLGVCLLRTKVPKQLMELKTNEVQDLSI